MPKRIAVIDDDIAFLNLLHDLLQEEGYEAHLCQESNGAHKRVRELRPDAIILDIRMESPASGWQVLDLLTLDPILARTPVIVCSADVTALHERAAHLQGTRYQILPKPFDLEDLLGMLQRSIAGQW